jgi:type IV pilus assembly protein PilA
LDWFYHAPGEGRVGPLSAATLRERYRERRIQRETLVWREGLPEWQPLERVADQVDLFSVTPDTRLPPPLPASLPAAMTAVATAGPRASARRPGAPARPQPRRMHGCLIALIVAGVASVPLTGIIAAIALPAYQDYTVRARTAAYLQPRITALQAGTARAQATLGRCPGDAREAGIDDSALAAGVNVGALTDGRCAFEITVAGVDPRVDGRSLLHVAPAAEGGPWDCSGGDLPARYRPTPCRTRPE